MLYYQSEVAQHAELYWIVGTMRTNQAAAFRAARATSAPPTNPALRPKRFVKAGIPVMIDFGGNNPPLSIRELFFDHLRPGDIFTHAFGQLGSREAIVDVTDDKVKPFVWEAQKRGIIFDVGYGGISFSYSQAIPAVKSKFYPNTISPDIHIGSMNGSM